MTNNAGSAATAALFFAASCAVLLLASSSPSTTTVTAFAPPSSTHSIAHQRRAIPTTTASSPLRRRIAESSSSTARHVVVPDPHDVVAAFDALERASDVIGSSSSSSSSDFLLSKVDGGDYRELLKTTIIVLLFGGGLIPAAIAANKSLIGTLTGQRSGGETKGDSNYVSDSGATGPTLPASSLLFASEKIPLVDVIAIVGRIQNVDSIADWRNLPSAKQSTLPTPTMWLPRAMFKENIRRSKFTGWPIDPESGDPIGGEELKNAELKRISNPKAEIGDAALDAVFDSWAWGASVATPDKVARQLKSWRADDRTFDLGAFVGAAIGGRAVTGIGALTFVVIQVVAYGSLFIAPALRQFANIDVGFGQLGTCDAETCIRLFGGN